MLQNEYLVAKIGVDTAENERLRLEAEEARRRRAEEEARRAAAEEEAADRAAREAHLGGGDAFPVRRLGQKKVMN